MSSKRRPSVSDERMPRRKVLRGLGALAVTTPALAGLGCGAGRSPAAGDESAGAVGPVGAGTDAGRGALTAPQPSAAGRLSTSTGTSGSSPAVSAGSGAGERAASASAPAGAQAAAGSGGSGAAVPSGVGAAGRGSLPVAGNVSSAGAAAASDVPKFDDAASCALTTTDIEGPFYIDEAEVMDDVSMIRRDIRDNQAGCEFRLYFKLMDARDKCTPIPDVELYLWHCNAEGYYSGFTGQDPSKPYTGSANPAPANLERFLRGVQYTDAAGVASFVTIYPGWYAGRQIHMHLTGRMRGQTTRLITTQLYFPAAFTLEVHQSEPAYMARAANIPAGSVNPPSGKRALPTLEHTPGLVIGTLNVIVDG